MNQPPQLTLSLTPHGHLALIADSEASPLTQALTERLSHAFQLGTGHGLLLLGIEEAGSSLPPVLSYWREFGASYVTGICTRQEERGAAPAPPAALDHLVLSAPPMLGAEYLTAEVLQ